MDRQIGWQDWKEITEREMDIQEQTEPQTDKANTQIYRQANWNG